MVSRGVGKGKATEYICVSVSRAGLILDRVVICSEN